jgi:hypothetical protein
MNETVGKSAINNNHALVRSLAREAEQRLSVPTLKSLLLDRLMFPRKLLDEKGDLIGLGGEGEYIIVVKTAPIGRRQTMMGSPFVTLMRL